MILRPTLKKTARLSFEEGFAKLHKVTWISLYRRQKWMHKPETFDEV